MGNCCAPSDSPVHRELCAFWESSPCWGPSSISSLASGCWSRWSLPSGRPLTMKVPGEQSEFVLSAGLFRSPFSLCFFGWLGDSEVHRHNSYAMTMPCQRDRRLSSPKRRSQCVQSRYIHLNPVRAKIVETPEQYEWSSYKQYIGKQKPAKWLCRDFILFEQVGLVFTKDKVMARNVKMYLCQKYTGNKLKKNRFALRHRGIRSITGYQTCSSKDRKR